MAVTTASVADLRQAVATAIASATSYVEGPWLAPLWELVPRPEMAGRYAVWSPASEPQAGRRASRGTTYMRTTIEVVWGRQLHLDNPTPSLDAATDDEAAIVAAVVEQTSHPGMSGPPLLVAAVRDVVPEPLLVIGTLRFHVNHLLS